MDVFFWRSLFLAAMIAALMVGAGLAWLVARIRGRTRSVHGHAARPRQNVALTEHSRRAAV